MPKPARTDCPCFVKVYWISVGPRSTGLLKLLAGLYELVTSTFALRPTKDIYHAALKVQVPEGRECPVYVVEMTTYIGDVQEARRKGQAKDGRVDGGIWQAFAPGDRKRYGIRKWRNGRIGDERRAAPNPVAVMTDCAKAQCVLDMVVRVPTNDWGADENDYGEIWTSNSVVAWLLKKCDLDRGVRPPPNGRAPGWDAGLRAAR